MGITKDLEKRGNMHNALGKIFTEQAEKQATLETEKRKAYRTGISEGVGCGVNTLGKKLIKNKVLAITEATKQTLDLLVCKILRESIPMDLSNISDETLLTEVNKIKASYGMLFNESALTTPMGMPTGVDVNSPNTINLAIGSANPISPAKIARNVIRINAEVAANSGTNPLNDTKISLAYNNLDTAIMRADCADTKFAGSASYDMCKALLTRIADTFTQSIGSEIKGRLARSLNADKERAELSESAYIGLSESTVEIRKQRSVQHITCSITEELYQTIAMLQEGNSPQNILNETFFQAAVIETFNILGAIKTESAEKTALEIRKARRKVFAEAMELRNIVQSGSIKDSESLYDKIAFTYAHDTATEANTNKDLDNNYSYMQPRTY